MCIRDSDIPQDIEYYVHRIGRTGRAGRSGQAFTFVSGRRQMMELKDLSLIHISMTRQVLNTSERECMASDIIAPDMAKIPAASLHNESRILRKILIIDT